LQAGGTIDREPRIATRCRVLIDYQGQRIAAESEDLSTRGMFIRCDSEIGAGTVLDLRVAFPGRPEFSIRARVAHRLTPESARALGRSAGLGVEFLDRGSAERSLVVDYVDETNRELASTTPEGTIEQRRLLVADPNTPLLVRLTNALEGPASYQVDTVTNGADALVSAMQERPDVILASAVMPFMSGLDLLRKIREHDRLAELPVLIMLDGDSSMARLEALRLGATDVIDKPFTDDELAIRLARALEPRRPAAKGGEREVALHGRLGDISLGTLLSLLEFERKSGVLRLASPAGQGRIHISEGRVVRVDGVAEALDPRERLMCLLDQDGGEFEFAPGKVEGPDEIGSSTQQLLLEHAKVVDEG